MIVDTSALVAIVFREPGYEDLLAAIAAEPGAGIGTPTLAELGLVLTARLGEDARPLLLRLLDELALDEVTFGEDHWRQAVSAFVRFGRGRHPAHLNFGDCLTYAVAKLANEPLLYVGNDFAATDIEAA